MNATIIGYGSWGTAISVLLASKGVDVTVTARNKDFLADVFASRENSKYLPGVPIPDSVNFEPEAGKALYGADFVIFSVPAQHFRESLSKYRANIPGGAVLVNTAKGIEQNTLKRLSEIAAETAPEFKYVALSGPSHAEEVGKGIPTCIVAGAKDEQTAKYVQNIFMSEVFRVYTSPDIKGMELGAALKNVVALAAGVADGLGYGDNTKAALITRGIAEITRIGIAAGGQAATFQGLTGIGDLIVTCASMHSRNRRAGILIGQGKTPDEAMKEVQQVVEGVFSAKAAKKLAEKYEIEAPIIDEVCAVLFENKQPAEAVRDLMLRDRKVEANDLDWN